MKVKIKNKIYDANEEPIMIIFDEIDKSNISNMDTDDYKYCCYPDALDPKEIDKFMGN